MDKKLVIGILAHVDAGKTTLSESMLYQSGSIRKLGRVDKGDAFLDTYQLERERGITIFSKQAQLSIGDLKITLLDTPGHVDFSAEMERTLQVLDYAILVINGADGIQGHTETLWRLLERYQIPVFLFINKMDQAGTDKDKLIKELKKQIQKQYSKQPLAHKEYGKIINLKHFDRLLGLIDYDKVVYGGTFDHHTLQIEPTIMDNVTFADAVMQEEIFGPVVVVQKFKTVDEVIELANDSVYGLGGGVFTGSLNTAMKVSRGVQTGRVWVNTYNAIPAGAPFGGYKESGIGRETHKVMLEHYSQTKNIMINLKEGTTGLYDVK